MPIGKQCCSHIIRAAEATRAVWPARSQTEIDTGKAASPWLHRETT
jgi:hypothetical protein